MMGQTLPINWCRISSINSYVSSRECSFSLTQCWGWPIVVRHECLATSSCMMFGAFHGFHSPKTTMTMEKHNHLKMYLLIKRISGFSGMYFPYVWKRWVCPSLRQEKSRKSRWHFEGECSPTKWKERDSRSLIMRHSEVFGGFYCEQETKPYRALIDVCETKQNFVWFYLKICLIWVHVRWTLTLCRISLHVQEQYTESDIEQRRGETQSISRVSCVKSALSPWWLWSLFETEIAMVCCDPISNFVRQIIQVPTWPRTCCVFFPGVLWRIESRMMIVGDKLLLVWKRYLFYVFVYSLSAKPCGFLEGVVGTQLFFLVTFFSTSTRGETDC